MRARSPRASDAARALATSARIQDPGDLDLELLVMDAGITVLWSELAGEEGHIVSAKPHAVARVAERLRGTPRGRFVIAHEIGHHLLHGEFDHFARCTGGELPSGGTRWRIESEANDFAMELLLPQAAVSARIAGARVTLDDVSRIARSFGASLSATAIRVAELARTPCAVVCSRGNRVEWWRPSAAFRAVTARGRVLDGRTLAARISSGQLPARAQGAVPGAAWGKPRLGVDVYEDALALGRTGLTLSWLYHEAAAGRATPQSERPRKSTR